MVDCTSDIVEGLDPSCEALEKVGGIKKRVWIGNLDEIVYTQDENGYVDSITMTGGSPIPTLFRFTGKKYKHTQKITGVIGTNVNIFTQDMLLVLYYYTPAEREAIEGLYHADDVVIFIETESGQIEISGLDKGCIASAAAGGIGATLNDDTALTLTMTASETKLPYVFRAGSSDDLQVSKDYLDGISV